MVNNMAMMITTQITNNELTNGDNGLELNSVTVVVNFVDGVNYFGGQVVLTKDDDSISLQSTTEEINTKAIHKAKDKIAESAIQSVSEVSNG